MKKIQMDKPKEEGPVVPDKIEYDEELDTSNHLMNRRYGEPLSNEDAANVKISDNRRPIIGVLTEPLRGGIRNKKDSSKRFESKAGEVSYIPKAHVQFLEQSGALVVPISYTKSLEEIEKELKSVNAVYIPGDSEQSITND